MSGPALLLVRGEHERVVDWARKGVVAVHVVPLAEGWTGVLPAGERSAAAPPNDYAQRPPGLPAPHSNNGHVGLNLSYTINLNLPATADQAVFNAIFRSLKEHLLSGNE